MIAKHVSMRSARKSSFGELVRYMAQGKPRIERVGEVTVTNCVTGDAVEPAIAEVGHTQARNTRSGADKTYHLLISFPVGEEPGREVLAEIEARLCASIGYAEHQRISAVHTDTDCLHLHVAISKVHPKRLTVHTPKGDFYTLGQTCAALEVEFGLQATNHQRVKTGSLNAGDDMERIGRLESLQGWVRRECAPALAGASDWPAFHATLSEHGLSAQARGNGLVFVDAEGLAVKASTIGREFSKAALEKRLGPFVAGAGARAPGGDVGRAKRYEPRPMKPARTTAALYSRYEQERVTRRSVRGERIDVSRASFRREVEAAKSSAKAKRAALRLARPGLITRKALNGAIQRDLLAEIDRARSRQQIERETINAVTRAPGWSDWLKSEAARGDAAALEALRSSGARGVGGAFIGGRDHGGARQGSAQGGLVGGHVQGRGVDHVTRNGTAVTRVGHALVRDDGERFRLSESITDAALFGTLREAVEQFGSHLSVDGSEAFQERVAQMAVRTPFAITFDTAALEARRQSLMAVQSQGVGHGSRAAGPGAGSGVDAGGSGAGSAGRAGGAEGNGVAPASSEAGRGRGSAAGTGSVRESGRFAIGARPPPEARHRLRTLSELAVVQLGERAEVLLPAHVPGDVEQGNVGKPDPRLRRADAGHGGERAVGRSGAVRSAAVSGLGSGPGSDDGWAQADKYIAEREEKRARGLGIAEHRRFDARDAQSGGRFYFAGVRTIDDRDLVLLRKGHQVLVRPAVSGETAKLAGVRIDTPLGVRGGLLQIVRGRSL